MCAGLRSGRPASELLLDFRERGVRRIGNDDIGTRSRDLDFVAREPDGVRVLIRRERVFPIGAGCVIIVPMNAPIETVLKLHGARTRRLFEYVAGQAFTQT